MEMSSLLEEILSEQEQNIWLFIEPTEFHFVSRVHITRLCSILYDEEKSIEALLVYDPVQNRTKPLTHRILVNEQLRLAPLL